VTSSLFSLKSNPFAKLTIALGVRTALLQCESEHALCMALVGKSFSAMLACLGFAFVSHDHSSQKSSKKTSTTHSKGFSPE
jgi:hypothetical protein